MKKRIGSIIGIVVIFAVVLAVILFLSKKKEQESISVINGADGPTLAFIADKTNEDKFYEALPEDGIAPYEFTEDEQLVLNAFGMYDTAKLIAFRAPEETLTVHVNAYRLTDKQEWDLIGNGSMSIGAEREPVAQLVGSIAMNLQENYKIDIQVNGAGQMTFSTEEIVPEQEIVQSTKGYLETFQPIELNQEIPIAVMVYDSGNGMRPFGPKDYYEPSVFERMDLVQVVTVEFSELEL